jgi:hypothetical protein
MTGMWRRLVVDMVGDPVEGRLAESQFVDKPFAFGGEANCVALACAAAELGYETELRGWIHEPTFRRFQEASRAVPRVNLPAREPEPDDFVVVPEGWADSLRYLQLSLSPARLAIYVLAAPGLFGWPFAGEGWTPPDPLTVRIGDLARPEHFRGMRALGFELVTHSEGIASAAQSAGEECRLTGVGEPWDPAPGDERREVDVLALMHNRWAPLAQEVLERLDGLNVDAVPTVSNDEMLRRMGRAKVLVWPSRIEGHATIPIEARAMGCVPVALDTNPFGAALDEEHGVVTVGSVDAIPLTVRKLLGDDVRLKELSELGRSVARKLTDWSAFVHRVRAFLEAAPPADYGRQGRAVAGASLRESLRRERATRQAQLEERLLQVEAARHELTGATERQARLLDENFYLRGEVERLYRIPFVRAALHAQRLRSRLRGPA